MSAPRETAFRRVVDQLGKTQTIIEDKPDRHAKVQCPIPGGHPNGDRDPSLSITRIEGGIMLVCHCTEENAYIPIADFLGWPYGELLHDDPSGKMIYPYSDGSRAVRSYDKRGKKRIRYYGHEKGARTVLYHLERITEARSKGEPIFLVGSEKDVHALESIGVYATCAPMGEGNWKHVDHTPLHGMEVIAIAHRDTDGTKWAQAVQVDLEEDCQLNFARSAVDREKADAADHIAEGYSLAQLVPWVPPPVDDDQAGDDDGDERRVVLTPASAITPRRVYWLWSARLALGTLALLAGREGVGKSILAYTIAAMITKGELPGEFFGTPKSVLVAAAEDSWTQTIVPRLIAAGADLDRVFRVEIEIDGIHDELTMPRDLAGLRASAREVDAALLILDPLISRLSDRLDTHKDADVRRALEPLVAMADQVRLAVWGLIHHNKSGSTDPLQVVMASKAFTAVARSVHTVISDPDDDHDQRRLFGTPKNNLGRTDLPTLSFTIDSYGVVIDSGDETDLALTGRLVWGDDSKASIFDAMRRSAESADDKSATTEAGEWLEDFLQSQGGNAPSATIKAAGKKVGHSEDSLKRARKKLDLHVSSAGFPRVTHWHSISESNLIRQSEQQSEQSLRGDSPTALTTPTDTQNPQSVQLEQSEQDGDTSALTDPPTDRDGVIVLYSGPVPGHDGPIEISIEASHSICDDCGNPITEPSPTCARRRRHWDGEKLFIPPVPHEPSPDEPWRARQLANGRKPA